MIWDSLLGKPHVRLHLRDDQGSIEGILVSRGRHYVMVAARLLRPDAEHVLDGSVYVPREQVVFFQRMAA